MKLAEREAALLTFDRQLEGTRGGGGHVLLVCGEAGIGKTTLLKAFAQRRGDASLWWGACDPLETPHPLAPLHDIARGTDIAFRALLQPGVERAALYEAVLAALQSSVTPVVAVFEDVHWADEATLDLLKFLGRRIDRVPCLLVLSWRDDEVSATHPLRRLLGELPSSLATRLALQPLSPAAVARLAAQAMRPAAGVHAMTRGNPLFVSELLRHGTEGVPQRVQDLVLARFARLGEAAQAVVRLASTVPTRIDSALVDDLLAPSPRVLDECLDSGLLNAADGSYFFRHELVRVAIEASLSPPLARALHGDVLAALARPRHAGVSLARHVHHAVRAGDARAVATLAPAAAVQALQRGAHGEAAAHYRIALTHAGPEDDQGAWLAAYALECRLTNQLEEAIAAHGRLTAWHREHPDPQREAVNLCGLALAQVLALRNGEADASSQRAIATLAGLPPGPELARAYRVEAQLRMLNRDCNAAVAWAQRAIALAEALSEREILAEAVGTLGTAMLFLDYDAGCGHLERALALALADGLHGLAANSLSNLGSGSGEVWRLREARRHLQAAIAFSQQHEIDFYRHYAVAWLALCELHLGQWDDAREHALDVVQQAASPTTSRVMALAALGRLQARRGEPEATATLDEALALALASGTLQRVAPVRCARAEAAWLRGDLSAAAAEAGAALPLAQAHGHPWFSGELALWLRRAGAAVDVPAACAPPHALLLEGRWREAAAAWGELGAPFERALALAGGDDAGRLEALAVFDELGARPVAARVRQSLRAAGVRGIPRGVRASTQVNPHQLTEREREILELLCGGLRNSEIAERLCRSVRTVDHHVAATFAKLGVGPRAEAVAVARRAGLAGQNG
jgi:DNA-binding CsgD family transcriptional regulator/tetratricopeptide (TPR) repeat protein